MRYLITIFLMLVMWSGALAERLGGETEESTPGRISSGNNVAQLWAMGPFTVPTNGTATSISIYSENANGEDFVMGIYSNHTPVRDHPEDLLRQTTAGAAGADGWQTQDLTSDYSLVSGTKYWILVNFAAAATHYYVSGSPTRYFATPGYSPTMADPTPIVATTSRTDGRLYGAYITYTATGGGGWQGQVIPVTIQ